MENEEKKEEGKGCCGKSHCCGKKAIGALALLIVGGAVGFFAGRHCAGGMCPLKSMSAPAATAPAAPAAPAK